MTSTFTTDFREEFEAERGRWLRKRFLWYAGVTLALSVLGLIIGLGTVILLLTLAEGDTPPEVRSSLSVAIWGTVPGLISMGMYVWAFQFVRRRLLPRHATLRIVYWLIVIGGALSIVSSAVQFEVQAAEFEAIRAARAERQAGAAAAEAAVSEGAAPVEAPPSSVQPAESEPAPAVAAADPAEATPGEDAGPDIRVGIGSGARVEGRTGALVGINGWATIFFTHFFACLFLPWTPRESIRPIIPLVILNAVVTLVYMGDSVWLAIFAILASPLVAAPGAAICWWRNSRFRSQFHYAALSGRYGEMKRELTDARRIHEALFPKSIRTGPVRFDFRYEPMRQIGGDFLYTHRFPGVGDGESESEPLSIVIIDVTGHGIPAALTVNRLHGELERLFAEEPDISPGDVLTALNRYVHLTLATHSVYATALCLRVDPRVDTLEWASGGHPPAFLRAVDGRIDRLDSTAFVLGACHGRDFQPNQNTLRFGRGDVLIAYTDGATEARDQRGVMVRVEGLQRIIAAAGASPPGGWASEVLRAVDEHRFGPPADDTIIIEVVRPLSK